MDILSILDERGVNYESTSEGVAIVCPRQALHAGGIDNRPSFRINLDKEVGHCFACGFSLSQAGMYSWLMGDELDDLQLKALEIRGALRRIEEGKVPLISEVLEFFFPMGSPWEEDGYRGISLETYQELGAIKVTRGRYDNRICFPICVNGEIIGVDARYLGNADEDKVAKYLRNKGSSCRHNWLFPYDKVKAQKPQRVLLGEGLFHAINAFDKGAPGLCYFGVNNWSEHKVMMLLSMGVTEVVYVPDPDKAGYQAMQRVCASLAPWFKVYSADMSPYWGTKTDLGDLTEKQIKLAFRDREEPWIPLCLLEQWDAKIAHGEKCRRIKCKFNRWGACDNTLFELEVHPSSQGAAE